LILVVRFFMSLSATPPEGQAGFVRMMLSAQLGMVAAPAMLMTLMLTTSPRQTLLLRRPGLLTVPAAILLAVFLHPVVIALSEAVGQLYPMSDALKEAFQGLFPKDMPFVYLLLLAAVLPAICEELAFRGFILSGFLKLGGKWRAIIYTALLFGFMHAILQQQMITFLVGIVVGYVAVQTRSIWPCMAFHATHNSLALAAAGMPESLRGPLTRPGADGEGFAYHWPIVLAGAGAAWITLLWFSRLSNERSANERIGNEGVAEPIERGLSPEIS